MARTILLAVVSVLLVSYVQSFNEADYDEGDMPAVVNVPEYGYKKNDPKPCCLPKQWQGNITSQSGSSGGRFGGKYMYHSNMVFVDETNKRIAGRGPAGRFRNETGGFVVLFGSNDTANAYFFIMNKQKCWKKELRRAEFRPQCIPANATHFGDFNLGPASSGLSVQGWAFRVKKTGHRGKFFMGGRILVVPDTCVPVYVQDHGMFFSRGPHSESSDDNEIVFDEDYDEDKHRPGPGPRPGPHRGGKGFVASAYFSNVEGSIKDPTVFTPPSYCNATVSVDQPPMEGYEELSDVIDRFVTVM